MIDFETFTLNNGLKVIVHPDPSVKTVVLNVLYDVGSRDEHPNRTGFAHLFEHLMFGGSKHIPSYDQPLQAVGAQNNAFTSTDLTNYYVVAPATNMETAFWVESDRMLSLSFKKEVLEVQRKVVIEEFKQRYLNQPYGDVWLHLRPLAYTTHPYQWPTIGKEISHIAEASMKEVKDFYSTYYVPANATLVLAGAISIKEAKALSEKWFGDIPGGEKPVRDLPEEPKQTQKRSKTIEADVPLNGLYKCWHMPARTHPDYIPADLVSDVLGRDKSARLYQKLVQEEPLFNSINAYVTGSIDPGLLCITGKLNKGVSPEEGEDGLEEVVAELLNEGIHEEEVEKVKNQALSSLNFEDVELFNRAFKLAYFDLLGDVHQYNSLSSEIKAVSQNQIELQARKILMEENSSVLYYQAKS